MKGECAETRHDPPGPPITLLSEAGNPAPLHGDQGELAGDEEGVDRQENYDECQRGGGTNEAAPGFSQSGGRLAPRVTETGARETCPTPFVPCWQEVKVIIDCQQCAMLDTSACEDCVVTVLLGDKPVEVDEAEATAMEALAEQGLVPRLRLVPAERRAG